MVHPSALGMPAGGRTGVHRRRQRGQSLVEFAISSMVLLLLAMGLIDLSRAFYFSVSLQGAAREGARHGAWFNTAARQNNFLDDNDVMTAVKQALYGAGFTDAQIHLMNSGGCLAPSDSNVNGNKPYPAAARSISTSRSSRLRTKAPAWPCARLTSSTRTAPPTLGRPTPTWPTPSPATP